MENLKEMDSFLNGYHLPKLNQEQINNLNRLITPKEIEAGIIISQPKRGPEPEHFCPEFYQGSKEKLTPILLKLSHKIKIEETLLN